MCLSAEPRVWCPLPQFSQFDSTRPMLGVKTLEDHLDDARKLVEAFVADSREPKLASLLSPRPPAPAPPLAEAAIYTPPTRLVTTAGAS